MRIELTRLATHGPQPCLSTSSSTRAFGFVFYPSCFGGADGAVTEVLVEVSVWDTLGADAGISELALVSIGLAVVAGVLVVELVGRVLACLSVLGFSDFSFAPAVVFGLAVGELMGRFFSLAKSSSVFPVALVLACIASAREVHINMKAVVLVTFVSILSAPLAPNTV